MKRCAIHLCFVNRNDLIRILLFAGIYFSIASCASLHRDEGKGERVTSSTDSPGNFLSPMRKSIVEEAEKHLGVRYKYAGESPKGFDCSGFTQYVVGKFGFPLSRTAQSQLKEGNPISAAKAQPGDLVFFRRTKGGPVFHVALVISNDKEGLKVIHSTSSRGVVVDKIAENSYWGTKILSFRDVISGK